MRSSSVRLLFAVVLASLAGLTVAIAQPPTLPSLTVPVPAKAQEPPAPLTPPRKLEQPPGKKPVVAEPPEELLELVEFRDVPLSEAVRILAQQSKLNIVASSEAGNTRVTLYLQNVTPSTAVATIAQAHGLVTRRDATSGILRIFTPKENQRDLSSFREDQTEVFTLLYPNAMNVATAINDLFGGRVQLSYGPNDFTQQLELQARFNRFDLLNSRSLGIGLPQGGIGGGFGGGFGGGLGGGFGGGLGGFGGGLGGGFGGGLGGFGGGLGGGFGGGLGGGGNFNQLNQLNNRLLEQQQQALQPGERLKTYTPEEVQALEDALGKEGPVDRAAVLEAIRRRTPANIFVTIIKANNQLMVRTSDQTAMAQIRDLVARLDVPTPVVLLEVKVLSINLNDDFRSVFDYQFSDGLTTAAGFTTGDILPPLAAQVGDFDRRKQSILPGATAGNPGTDRDLVFQFVSATFRARLQLLEDKNRITELATPLLMTANNEVSRIFVGESRPITVGFNAPQVLAAGVGATNTVAGTPVTTLQDLGTTLLITPNINNDRTVTLRILQENSSVIPQGGSIPVANANGTVSQVGVDTVRRQNLSGTIVAKDGLTIAVGGLIEESVTDNRSQVPILGRIPGIGYFFRRQFTERARRELIVLVRPFVLSTPHESAGATDLLVRTLSIHPKVACQPEIGQGTMNTFTPYEVPRAIPPQTPAQRMFQIHSIYPKLN